MIIRHYHMAFLASLLVLSGCGKDRELPSVDGAQVKLFGGRERILCTWENVPSGIDKLRFTVDGTVTEADAGSGKSKVFISGAKEGDRRCDVSFLAGKSVLSGPNLGVRVYGADYEKGLAGRTATVLSLSNYRMDLKFDSSASSDIIGEEVKYIDKGGAEVTRYYARTDGMLSIDGISKPVEYRSIYVPVPETGDKFYSSFSAFKWNDSPLPEQICEVVDGYRGIWFTLGQVNTEYGDKYSGGLGTYTMKHIPMAIYAPEVDKTFFVYGGTPSEPKRYLQCMIGCYDHRTGLLQKPRMVMDKGALGVSDPHDNPTVQLDKDGYVWVFVSGRGNKREGYRYKSINPYDITAFEVVGHDIMAYPQVMYNPSRGFFLFYTRYDGTRQLFWRTSPDGVTWTDYRQLASIKEGTEKNSGHYQISNICGTKLCTAFNRHINGDVDTRTNIYYVQSTDWGQNWTTASGEAVSVPVKDRYSNALLIDYQTQGKNCYIKDLNFDLDGNPVILYLISDNHLTGPEGGIREWFTLHWNGTSWDQTKIAESTHCYDSGSLWVSNDDGKETWTILAPTEPGPQYWGAGGEVCRYISIDRGKTWTGPVAITSNSTFNNTYMRRPWGASEGFWSFWANGHTDSMSRSELFFCTREGKVYRMPYNMTDEWQAPTEVL